MKIKNAKIKREKLKKCREIAKQHNRKDKRETVKFLVKNGLTLE